MGSDSVLLEKLETLRRCLERVRTKTPASAAILRADLVFQIATHHLDDFRAFMRELSPLAQKSD